MLKEIMNFIFCTNRVKVHPFINTQNEALERTLQTANDTENTNNPRTGQITPPTNLNLEDLFTAHNPFSSTPSTQDSDKNASHTPKSPNFITHQVTDGDAFPAFNSEDFEGLLGKMNNPFPE